MPSAAPARNPAGKARGVNRKQKIVNPSQRVYLALSAKSASIETS